MSRVHRSRITIERPGNPGLYLLPAGMPAHWEVLGVVSTSEQTGALVRHRATGVYCQANAGALRSLPQRKVRAILEQDHGA